MGNDDKPQKVEIWEGNILLYTRLVRGKLNPIWQAKITTASGKGRIRISTKSRHLPEAKRIAIKHYKQAEARVQTGLPLNRVTWKTAAKRYINWQHQRVKAGRCSQASHNYHKRIIEQCLNPAFTGKFLNEIRSADIDKYHAERRNLGVNVRKNTRVSAHTINLDNAVVNPGDKMGHRNGQIIWL